VYEVAPPSLLIHHFEIKEKKEKRGKETVKDKQAKEFLKKDKNEPK